MDKLLDDVAQVLERLASRVTELEARVASLEGRPQAVNSLPIRPASSDAASLHPMEQISLARTAGVMPAVGKVFLGLAGAYLLRAASESGRFPEMAVVLVALAYAASWLVWASRVHPGARIVSTAYATTAALIFSPMLWELTLRFKVLPARISAGALVAFVVLAAGLAWKHKLTMVVWVATFFASTTALVLLIATRDPAPFALALLLIAVITEFAGLSDRWRSVRPVAALLTDFAILTLTIVYSGEAGTPPEYKPIGTATLVTLMAGLFAIYGGSVALRTVALTRKIGPFEIAQTITAFLLALVSIQRATHGAAGPWLGAFCLLSAGVCYCAGFIRFDSSVQPRNYHVFANWGAALLVVGSFLLLPTVTLGLWLSFAAVAATLISTRLARWTLAFHGALYLGIAAYVSGLLEYAGRALAGLFPPSAEWVAWMPAGSAVICCWILWRPVRALDSLSQRNQWNQRALLVFFASLAVCAVAALSVAGTAWLASGGPVPSAPRLAVVRSIVLCATALVLSFSGARYQRLELVWIAYAAMAFWTLKLMFEDLRYGTAGSIALSLFFYGMSWVLVPRLVRSPSKPA